MADVVKERINFMITQINLNKQNYEIKQYKKKKVYNNLTFKADSIEFSKDSSKEDNRNKLKTAGLIGLGIILFFVGFRIGIINNVLFKD